MALCQGGDSDTSTDVEVGTLRRGVVAARGGGREINYYRASVRQSQKEAAAKLRPISAPLVIWGSAIPTSAPTLAEPERDDVPNLDRVERLPDASHWVHHDEADHVNQLLIDFFAPVA